MNDLFVQQFSLPAAAVVGTQITAQTPDPSPWMQALKAADAPITFETVLNASPKPLHVCVRLAFFDDSARPYILCALRPARLDTRHVLQAVLDSSPQSIFWKDTNSIYLGCNRVFAEESGLASPDDIIGKSDFDLPWPKREADAYRADDQEVMREKRRKAHIVEPLQRADGSRRWIETTKSPLTDDQGHVFGVLGLYNDLTENYQARESLTLSELRFRTVLDGLSKIAVQAYEPDGTITYWNKASEDIYGYSGAECLGKNILDILHTAESRQAEVQLMATALDTGVLPIAGEVDVVRKDGSNLTIYANRLLLKRPNLPPEFFCLDVDISDIKRSRAELEERQQMVNDIVETSEDWIWTIDIHGRHLYSNPAAERILGYPIAQVLQGGLGFVHPDDLSLASDTLQRSIDNKTGWSNIVLRWLHKDGSTKYLQSSAVPVRDAQGAIIGFRGVDRDVTAQRNTDEALRQAEKLSAVGQLAGGIAHDFNNMLLGILGAADFLALSLPADSPLQAEVTTIQDSSKRAADLVSKLLTFSRKAPIQRAPFDIHRAILQAIALLERTIDPRIKLTTALRAAHPTIYGDFTLLQNALLNLAVNARDAMPDGGQLSISTANLTPQQALRSYPSSPLSKANAYLQVSVCDSGSGIPPHILSRMFEPFFTTKPPGKGTGLGLAVTYGTVREHGGVISVDSSPSKGTTFRILLPTHDAPFQSSNIPQKTPLVRGAGLILVVDDEETIRTMACKLLTALGYQTIPATDGVQALEIFAARANEIDLVLLDMTMPKLSGTQTFTRLKELRPDVKVIISTGYTNRPDLDELKAAGVLGFLPKPYQVGTMSALIHEVIQKGKPAR